MASNIVQTEMAQIPSAPALPQAPPPYDDHIAKGASPEDKTGRDLKESFAALLREQLNVQRLFATVLARLEHTERIGTGHSLYAEWEALREVRPRFPC
jgi:hypothetical protein